MSTKETLGSGSQVGKREDGNADSANGSKLFDMWIQSGNYSYRNEQYRFVKTKILALKSFGINDFSWRNVRSLVVEKSDIGWTASRSRLSAMISQIGLYGEFSHE